MPKSRFFKTDPHELTPQQRKFVELFCTYWVGKRAAIEAGYSENSAYSIASDLLNLPKIQAAVAEEKAKRAQEVAHRRERLRNELDQISFADLLDAFDDRGRIKNFRTIPEALRRAISSVKVHEDGSVEIKLWDKLGAAKLVAQLDGLLVEKVEHEHKAKIEQLLVLAQQIREQRKSKRGEAA